MKNCLIVVSATLAAAMYYCTLKMYSKCEAFLKCGRKRVLIVLQEKKKCMQHFQGIKLSECQWMKVEYAVDEMEASHIPKKSHNINVSVCWKIQREFIFYCVYR